MLAALVATFARIESAIAPAGAADDLVERTMALLDRQPRTSLPAVARAAGIPYDELRRRFKAATGSSPGAWRIRRRIDQARDLLSRLTVQETAERLGYPDAFGFSRQFRRQTGIAPSEFQRRLRQGVIGLIPGA
jgi:AraC-like DNA-binding protein